MNREDSPQRRAAPCGLRPLIEQIRLLEEQGRPWRLSGEEVRTLLGVESAAFLRALYREELAGNPLLGLRTASDSFSQDSAGELVALVELFCGAESEGQLRRSGIFLSHPDQLEVIDTFLEVTAEAIRNHPLEAEQFAAMLRTFGAFEKARRVYLEEHFSLPDLIRQAAERYCSAHSFELAELARANAERVVGYFFQKHVLEPWTVFAALNARLLQEAVRLGYARPRPEEGGEEARPAAGCRESRLQRARRVMELGGQALSLPLVKRQYKRLMKRYHPDVNPAGLQRCQEINAAYSLLLAVL